MAKEHLFGTLYEFERLQSETPPVDGKAPEKKDYIGTEPLPITIDLLDVAAIQPAKIGSPRVVVDWATVIYNKGSDDGIIVLTGYKRMQSIWGEFSGKV